MASPGPGEAADRRSNRLGAEQGGARPGGSLLTDLPRGAARNNSPDRLSQTARRQEPSKGVGAAIRQIVKGR
jgi:hypothetical protein